MKGQINHNLAHKFVIGDLVIRTLEYDNQFIKPFKIQPILNNLFEKASKQAMLELQMTKKEMVRENLNFIEEQKNTTNNFVDYIFSQNGLTQTITYSTYALRNQTFAEIERLLTL